MDITTPPATETTILSPTPAAATTQNTVSGVFAKVENTVETDVAAVEQDLKVDEQDVRTFQQKHPYLCLLIAFVLGALCGVLTR